MLTWEKGAAGLLAMGLLALAAASAPVEARGEKPLELTARLREETAEGQFAVREKKLRWVPTETAVIICDMWDEHWCQGATRRGAELAPRMNRMAAEARRRGALIIHAPSDTMKFYAEHPARKRAQAAPMAANLPKEIGVWCKSIPAEEKGRYPIDQSDGGCDDTPTCKTRIAWSRQTPAIEVRDEDAVSDSGVEIWNLLEQRGIKNVLIYGVHTNMCVLGRPFGLRNLSRNGKNVVLVRDLTDTMYNSRAWPYVDHFRGTELIVEHVEKYVCPTVTSDQLLGGSPFRFREGARRAARGSGPL